MFKKFGILTLAVMFVGSMAWVPVIDSVDAAVKCDCKAGEKGCNCGKGCGCEHCRTGKGECKCHAGGKGCACGKDCKCEHCMTGKGECRCKAGEKGCNCGKGCGCEHCKTGKGECKCHAGGKGCACGKDCKCEHCMTGKGECKCHAGGKGCQCGKDCKCAHCMASGTDASVQKPTSDAEYAKTMKSKGGDFTAAYTSDPDAIPVNKIISWKLKVETADGQAVKDAEIAVNGDMPEHGHGLPTQPQVTKNFGDGTYLVEGIKFSMPGWWTMTFAVKAAGKSDTVTFNLQVK